MNSGDSFTLRRCLHGRPNRQSCPVAYYASARALRHSIKSKRGLARFVFRSPHPLSPAGVTPRCTAPRATERDVCGDWLLDE